MIDKHNWPYVLIVAGFGSAIIFLSILLFAEPSSDIKTILVIGENLGIGVGSVGLGGLISRSRRK